MLNAIKFGLGLLLLVVSLATQAKEDLHEQRMKVVMREVGHEFLMQMNDSITRVMPVTKTDGRYKIQFEKNLAFEPDLLLFSASKIFEANDLNPAYIMEIEQCETHAVVHSAEYDPEDTEAVIACKSRPLPIDCYEFYFTFIEDDAVVVPTKPEEAFNRLYLIPFAVLGLVLILVFVKKKKGKASKEHVLSIGNYQFDVHRMKLVLNGIEEELSSKEADLLELLLSNMNQTLERDYILKVVWKDEGDYVGRTLDVSISKLRKKLQGDERIEIINSRGVGYRLVVED